MSLPSRLREKAGAITPDGEVQAVGRIKRLLVDRQIGFISPEDGGEDLYFNAKLLSSQQSWEELIELAQKYEPGTAPVLFVRNEYRGRTQAKGVIVLDDAELKDLDSDMDGHLSPAELAEFLAKNPELQGASRTKQEVEWQRRQEKWEMEKIRKDKEYEEQQRKYDEEEEEAAKRRDQLFKRLEDAEDELYKKRDSANAEATKMHEEANKLWDSGSNDACKELQAEAKELRQLARQLKQQAVDLDWKNNEEIFEYVQTGEHKGRLRDGSWIDLHGLSVDFALAKTEEAIEEAQDKGLPALEVITGAGHHSGKGGARVKPRVASMFKNRGLSFKWDSPGSAIVQLGSSAGYSGA